MTTTTIYFVNVGQHMHRKNYHLFTSYRPRMVEGANGREVGRARSSYDLHADRDGTANEKIARALNAYLVSKGIEDVGSHAV